LALGALALVRVLRGLLVATPDPAEPLATEPVSPGPL
jgi:hypothetical protein